jgi:hypothetical protein
MTSQQEHRMTETEEACESCERVTDELNDDGYCEPCQLERDIQRAEYARDMAGNR